MIKKIGKILASLRRKEEGFTLIELAVILAVIGILAGVGVMKYVDVTEGAKKTNAQARLADLKSNISMTMAKKGGNITVADVNTVISAAYDNATPSNGVITFDGIRQATESAFVVYTLYNGATACTAGTDPVTSAKITTPGTWNP
jgi:Tfp pilus assembly protein PilE